MKRIDITLRHITNNVFVKRQYRYLYAVRIVTLEKKNKIKWQPKREREREKRKNNAKNWRIRKIKENEQKDSRASHAKALKDWRFILCCYINFNNPNTMRKQTAQLTQTCFHSLDKLKTSHWKRFAIIYLRIYDDHYRNDGIQQLNRNMHMLRKRKKKIG